jgi:gas vesicle protein
MEDNSGYQNGHAMSWFFVGSLVGACSALLLAPASGKRTREQVTRKLRDAKESVVDFTGDIAAATRNIADKAGRIGDKAVRLAGDASAAARGVVRSLGETGERRGASDRGGSHGKAQADA